MYEQERIAKERASLQQQAGALGRGDAAPVPREAGMTDKASEALNYMLELESCHARLRERLYGPSPVDTSNQSDKNTREHSLEELLHHLCGRAAMAVGEMQTILNRL